MTELVILTPTLNASEMICSLVANINALSDCFRVVQYVGDGGSTDGTIDKLVQEARYEHYIHILPQKNIPETLNILAAEALNRHGPQITFTVLNADDQLYPDVMISYLDVYHTGYRTNSGDMLAGKIDVVSEGRALGYRLSSIDRLHDYMSVNHLGLLAPLSVWQTCSFPVLFPTAYDYIWLRTLLRCRPKLQLSVWNEKAIGSAEFGGLSYRKRYAAQREILHDDLKQGNYIRCIKRYVEFLAKELVRQTMPRKFVDQMIRRFRVKTRSIDNWMP